VSSKLQELNSSIQSFVTCCI